MSEVRFYSSHYLAILAETAVQTAFKRLTKGYKINETIFQEYWISSGLRIPFLLGGRPRSPLGMVFADRLGRSRFMTATTEDGISCHVICVERKAGKILWDNEVFKQKPTRIQQKNSYATPTAVTDGTLVYAVFKEGGIAAITFDGKIAWTNLDYPFYNQHGMATSPIVYKDLLITPYDTSATTGDLKIGWQKPWDQSFVLALEKTTGKQRWKAGRGMSHIGHCMPRIATIGGPDRTYQWGRRRARSIRSRHRPAHVGVPNIGETVVPTPVLRRRDDLHRIRLHGHHHPRLAARRKRGNDSIQPRVGI